MYEIMATQSHRANQSLDSYIKRYKKTHMNISNLAYQQKESEVSSKKNL